MNRFEDAIVDLFAGLGDGPDLESLTKRIRRHRRRRGVAVLAVLTAISVTSVSIAASIGKSSNGLVVAGSTSTTAPANNTWCVRLSRRDAIARVMNVAAVSSPAGSRNTAHAKLMTWAEFQHQSSPSSQNNSISDHAPFWIVEVQGAVRPEFALQSSTTYPWGVFALDADSAVISSMTTGAGAAPPYWDTLPDHGSECTAPTAPTTPTTTAGPLDQCDPRQPATLGIFDHATQLPIQIGRAYYCRRLAELQPSPDAHLSGDIYVANGKVTAAYHHTTDVLRHGRDTIVESKGTVPIDQLPPSLQNALRNP